MKILFKVIGDDGTELESGLVLELEDKAYPRLVGKGVRKLIAWLGWQLLTAGYLDDVALEDVWRCGTVYDNLAMAKRLEAEESGGLNPA